MEFSAQTIQAAVDAAHTSGATKTGGANANYIPYLASVPSDLFGVAVMTADGRLFKAGDTDYPFAIESISKVFTLALVTELIGADAVRQKVGTSPTGLPFNSVMALELHSGKPMSPLVNAGAIATVSLVPGDSADACWGKILDMQSRFAGRPIALSDEVNQSEQTTNFHNRAIGWLLYSAGHLLQRPNARGRRLHAAMLNTCHDDRSRGHGRHARRGRREPGDEAAGGRDNEHPAPACRNDHGRPLYGIRRMGILGGPSRQERGRRWYLGRCAGRSRHRCLLAAARSGRQ